MAFGLRSSTIFRRVEHEGDTLQPFAAAVREDEEVAAALVRERRGDVRHDRVGVELLVGDDPHVDVVTAHHRQQHGVEPDLEPALARLLLLAHREWLRQRLDRPIAPDVGVGR